MSAPSIRSSTFNPVYATDPDTGQLVVQIDGSVTITEVQAPTSTLTNVASSASSTVLLASNTNRKTAIIYNDSTSILYVKLNASAASTTSFSYVLAPVIGGIGGSLTLKGEDYSGEIRGIWASANGFARITEVVQ